MRFEADRAGRGGPADHRRHGARGATDDDVLRRAALEPHRVDEDIEADSEREQRGSEPIGHQPEADHRAEGEHGAKRASLARRHLPARDRTRRSAGHRRVDIGVVPHIEGTGRAGAGGDANQSGDGEHRVHRARRRHHSDQRREHHEEHHPRLHQRDIVGDLAAGIGFQRRGRYGICDVGHARSTHSYKLSSGRAERRCNRPHLMRGSVSKVWNGGGEDSVHSSVVAPTPQGFAAAGTLRANCAAMPYRNTKKPAKAM